VSNSSPAETTQNLCSDVGWNFWPSNAVFQRIGKGDSGIKMRPRDTAERKAERVIQFELLAESSRTELLRYEQFIRSPLGI
jgi:hypothetical protein